jgi:uncharacterized membrane protein
MSPPALLIRSPVLALAAGLALFGVFSLLRQAIQPHLGNAPYLGALLTVAIFMLPGVLVGAYSPRHSLLYGVVLGVLAGAIVTLQVGHFSHIHWTARPTLLVFGIFAGMGIIFCELGALAGRALALKWLSSRYRLERPPGL